MQADSCLICRNPCPSDGLPKASSDGRASKRFSSATVRSLADEDIKMIRRVLLYAGKDSLRSTRFGLRLASFCLGCWILLHEGAVKHG
jgi:hypothetical protein